MHNRKKKEFSCSLCANIFDSNEKISPAIFVKNKMNQLPCESTLQICAIGNKIYSEYLSKTHESLFQYDTLLRNIKKDINLENLYEKTDFDHNNNHKLLIIDLIIEEMIKIRSVYHARQMTMDLHKTYIRSAKTHDINFAGQ